MPFDRIDTSSHPRADDAEGLASQGFVLARDAGGVYVVELDRDGDWAGSDGPFADVDEALDAALHL